MLDIAILQDQWGRMWYDASDGTKLGDGTNMGIYHAGMTYTHLKGIRPRMGEFSIAITKPTAQPAGLLVKLDSVGNPMVDPASSPTGEKIVDVVGYAPTTDTFGVVQNWCNDRRAASGQDTTRRALLLRRRRRKSGLHACARCDAGMSLDAAELLKLGDADVQRH